LWQEKSIKPEKIYKQVLFVLIMKKIFVLILALAVLFAVILVISEKISLSANAIKEKKISSSQEIKLDYSNLAGFLSESNFVRDLPENSVLLLKFFNFNSGIRQWEKSFVIKRKDVKEGTYNTPDITLTLHSKYFSVLTNLNFCSVTKTANENRDLGFDTKHSKLVLMWKFRSMLKYRSCFGF